MKAKERIAQLERELAEVREELDLIERAETMERELAELKRRIVTRRPSYPQVYPGFTWNGWRCQWCGTWVYPNTYHVCQRWQPTFVSNTGGQLTSSVPTNEGNTTIGTVSSIMQKGLASKKLIGEDPPDMGVVAAI